MNGRRSLVILMAEALLGGGISNRSMHTLSITRSGIPELPNLHRLYYESLYTPHGRNVFFAIANRRPKRKKRNR